ncbi:fructosamine kinase family protein [Hahella ganghwensis]|uniref:fructosamine kinase family protein n=1 Tax=Hahella ganghwensis TaxID=286420 RepID=UPI000365CDE9|nr:fructosamine kinase family protein [Hahella ganghwensis]
MSDLSGLNSWLQRNAKGRIIGQTTVAGGCINEAGILRTDAGFCYFLKHNRRAPAGMFECEARSLKLMTETGTIRIPAVYFWDEQCLLMEYLEPAQARKDYWENFGRALAAMHRHTAQAFGLDIDTYCGTTKQPNTWTQDGYQFFAEQRLLMQGRLAQHQGLLQQTDLEMLEQICGKLPEWIPEQPASLIHGDLWSGNAHIGKRPAITG